MGSSKKHKKHKDRKSGSEEQSEQRPLKLVLKVPTPYSGSNSSTPQMINSNTTITIPNDITSSRERSSPSKTILDSEKIASNSLSISKKMKKKKSKKKHRKHSHHHSHHRHHHSHHRHRSSCSHHSRQSQEGLNTSSMTTPLLIKTSPVKSSSSKSGGKTQFQHFLNHLLKQLQRKDVQQFFAWPVSDIIAPGYSSIISHPMDFSTMKMKIDQNHYETLLEFKSDVKLICDNAMKYNRPETVYYKAADKLWRYTRNKLLNKDSLIEIARTYPGLSSYELGFHFDETTPGMAMEVDTSITENIQSNNLMNTIDSVATAEEDVQEMHVAEMLDEDGLTAEQILEEARKAAKEAADRLTLQRPNGSHLSFLRQRNDGTTTLSIVGSYGPEKVVNLEALTGRLQEGTAVLPPYKEPDSTRLRPIESLPTTPFSSHLPTLDSTNANLTEEQTSLLLSTYGDDELGLQYAQSLQQFASDTDYVVHLVDSLLDALTHGQHTKTATKLRELKEQQQNVQEGIQQVESSTDNEEVAKNQEIQAQLDETSVLIHQLESIQNQRLSSSNHPIKPSSEEEKLASQLTSKLTDIISNYATPGEVSDVNSVRKAMGITIKTEAV